MKKTYDFRGKMYETRPDSEADDPNDSCFSCSFWEEGDLNGGRCIAGEKLMKICIDEDVFFKEV